MRCKPLINGENLGDTGYWVRTQTFLEYVDKKDFYGGLQANEIEPFYIDEWFDRRDPKNVFFVLPTFYLQDGSVFFINGRHRTALLARFLGLLPLALTTPDIDGRPNSGVQLHAMSQVAFTSFMVRPIVMDEPFDLPDLEIKTTLPS